MILIAKFKEISEPFILRKLAQNLKRTSSKVKTHPYASDPEDCLIFNYEFTAQVEKHLVMEPFGNCSSQTKVSYRFKPRALRRMSRAHKGGLKKEELEQELEEEQHPRVRTTSSGRILN